MRPERLRHPCLRACRLLTAAGLVAGAGATAQAMQHTVHAKAAKYDEAPVVVREASVQMVQTYSSPTQYPLATAPDGYEVKVKRSRVRYANRADQQVPTYLLEGSVELENATRRHVEAVQVTTVFLNAFRERIGTDRHVIAKPMEPRQIMRIDWSKSLPHQEVFEVHFVVTAVRFSDGDVWTPTEELILLP